MPIFHIVTLGCRVNQCESDAIRHQLCEKGWQPAEAGEQPDVCIINTCTVTHKASMQSRQQIRQAIRAHAGARVIVTGCYAETEPETLTAIEGVDWVIGHGDKHRIPDMVLAGRRGIPQAEADTGQAFAATLPPSGTRTRPVLKIQDGCNAFCSYCIVPHARGRSRSMPEKDVLEALSALHTGGYREVVLSGIHLGCYGADLTPPLDLHALLCRIETTAPVDRIRLSSIEPRELTGPIIDLVAASKRFCPHFHIPMQSGDDGVLKRMRRPYNSQFFSRLVHRLSTTLPDAAIGADVLIGLPGEDDRAFANTLALVRKLPLSYLHVFPFSPRKGTPAASWTDIVPPPVIKERCRQVRAAGQEKRRAFYHRFIGRELTLLVESRRDRESGLLRGMTANYIPVLLQGSDGWMNRFATVRIVTVDKEGVRGTILDNEP